MFLKRISLLIIIIGVYTSVMVNHPSSGMKALGYQQVLDLYGGICAQVMGIRIVHQPGLRVIKEAHGDKVAAVVPGSKTDYPQILDSFIKQGYRAVVECSALDAWHTTADGQNYLEKIQRRAYRVVIFDGGHHLPTLGLAPDIIIIPLTHGYAAHSCMLDAIRAPVVAELAEEAGCMAVIATVPRWGLVKAEPSLIRITERIIADSPSSTARSAFKPKAAHGMSCSNGICFAFVDREYLENQTALSRQIDKISDEGMHKICLAFDYRYVDISSADRYCRSLSQQYQVPVVRVNEPLKVANALFSRGVGENELSKSGYYSKNH